MIEPLNPQDHTEEIVDGAPPDGSALSKGPGSGEVPKSAVTDGPEGFTARGFAIFKSFKDTYGAKVDVIESSAATVDAVWVYINGGATAGKEDNDGACHLNAEQAVELRDALDRWLQYVGAEVEPRTPSRSAKREGLEKDPSDDSGATVELKGVVWEQSMGNVKVLALDRIMPDDFPSGPVAIEIRALPGGDEG